MKSNSVSNVPLDVTAVKADATVLTDELPEGHLLAAVKRRAAENDAWQESSRELQPLKKSPTTEIPAVLKSALAEMHEPVVRTHEAPKGKLISAAKLAANRRNAQRSTGPRTKEGKNWSRQNAIKHGILSSVLLVNGREEEAALQELLASFRGEYQPQGRSEELLVEEIANSWWRLRQAHRFEADAIRRSAERNYLIGQGNATPEEAMQVFKQAVEEAERGACGGAEDLRSALRRICSLSTQDFSQSLSRVRARRYLEVCAEQDLRDLAEKLGLKATFDAALASQQSGATCWASLVPLDARLTLPADKDLSLILRYRSSIHRELAQNMDRLERIQRSRKGEHVPVPLRVNLSTGD